MQRWEVTLKFENRLLATLPENPDALKFVNEKRPENLKVKVEEVRPEELSEDETIRSKVVFRKRNGICYIDEHVIRGVLKNAIKRTEGVLGRKISGSKGLWMKFYTDPLFIPIGKVDDLKEEVIAHRVIDQTGSRGIVSVCEAFEEPTIKFILEYLDIEEIQDELVLKFLEVGGRYAGVGSHRGKSYLNGPFGLFKIVGFKPILEDKVWESSIELPKKEDKKEKKEEKVSKK